MRKKEVGSPKSESPKEVKAERLKAKGISADNQNNREIETKSEIEIPTSEISYIFAT